MINNIILWDDIAQVEDGGDEIYIGYGYSQDELTIRSCDIEGGWNGDGVKKDIGVSGSIEDGGGNIREYWS